MSEHPFFNHSAVAYQKYLSQHRGFRYFFHQERMRTALMDADLLPEHQVLDLGAGTGALYEYLLDRGLASNYYACDPSEAMLEQSRIPLERRFQGRAETLPNDWPQFDRVFVLGVSTYLSDSELRTALEALHCRAAPGARLVISFTNAHWWGLPLRRFVGALVPASWFPNRLLGKSTPFYPRELAGLPELLDGDWHILRHQWLNTSFPLKRVFPRWAFPWSARLRPWLSGFWASRLSSDYLITCQRL